MPNKIRGVDDFIIAGCIFLTLSPVYVWGHESVIFGVTIFVFLFCSRDSLKIFSPSKIQAAILVFVCSIFFLKLNGASYFGVLFFGVFLALLMFLPIERLANIFRFLKLIIAVSLIPGLVMWFLHHILGKNIFYMGALPVEFIPNELKRTAGEGYALYPFTVVLDYALELPFYRMQGPFDEPGWLGTICALLISAAGFNKNKSVNCILLISGFLSFSLAFYILFAIYILLTFKEHFLKYFLGFLAVTIVVSYFALDVVDNYILQRVEISESGISGYNRDGEQLNEEFTKFMNAPIDNIIFGLSEKVYDGSSSFKVLLINSGLIGVFLVFSIYLILIYLNRNVLGKQFAIFVFIFFLSSLQRPDIVKPFMVFIFFASPVMLSMINIKTNKKFG